MTTKIWWKTQGEKRQILSSAFAVRMFIAQKQPHSIGFLAGEKPIFAVCVFRWHYTV